MPITHLITILLHYLRIDFLTIPLAFLPPPPFLPPSPTPFHRSRFRIRRRWWVAIVHGHLDTRVVLVISLNIYIYSHSVKPAIVSLSQVRKTSSLAEKLGEKARRGGGGRGRRHVRLQCIVTGFAVSTHLQARLPRPPRRRLILPRSERGKVR